MRITAINATKGFTPIAFQAKIFDGHAHLGKVGNKNYGLSDLDKFVKQNLNIKINEQQTVDTIEKIAVSSGFVLTGEMNELAGNEKLLEMIKGRSEYVPIAVCQPNKTNGDISNIKELFKKHPEFSGLKFHPKFLPMANEADYMKAYEPYMEFAKKNNLACLFHCEGGQASPEKIYELAKKTPKVPVILGHSGAIENGSRVHREKVFEIFENSLKNKDANIHLDLSWVDWTTDGYPQRNQVDTTKILKIAEKYNATDKIIFGSDAPLGCFGEWENSGFNNKKCYEEAVGSFKQTIKFVFGDKSEKVTNQIFYDNADRLFCKRSAQKPTNPWLKRGGIAAAVVAVVFGVYEAVKHTQNNDKNPNKKIKAKIK